MIDEIPVRIERFRIDTKIPLVWLTYVPFVGWFYPFIFKKNDRFAMHHAKQAFVMAVFFTFIPTLFTFASVFIPNSLRALRLGFAVVITLSHISYFALCAYGFMKMKNKSEYSLPFFGPYAEKLNV